MIHINAVIRYNGVSLISCIKVYEIMDHYSDCITQEAGSWTRNNKNRITSEKIA